MKLYAVNINGEIGVSFQMIIQTWYICKPCGENTVAGQKLRVVLHL